MTGQFAYASGNMWTYGNAFDSMADFLMLTNQQAGTNFLSQVIDSFNLPGAWYDDFCWPAVAALKAYDPAYSKVFAGKDGTGTEYLEVFKNYVLANWKVVHDGDPPSTVHSLGTQKVWASIDQKTWAAYAPRFKGGAWQCDINADVNEQGLQPQNPGTNSIGPFQDSVMNGLLLIFATRLGALANSSDPKVAAAAKQAQAAQGTEIDFLLNWYGNGSSSDVPKWDESVLSFPTEADYKNHNYSAGVLVRERIGTYAQQNGSYPAVRMFDANRFWGGDQGLQLGGLVDQGTATTTNVAVGIMVGVKNRMAISDGGQPWIRSCSDAWPGSMCPSCYNAGGGGIFFRNLLYALRSGNTAIVARAKKQDYVDYVAALANTALTGPSPNPSQNAMFVDLTRLAVLNVAMYYENVLGITLPTPEPATAG